MHGLSFCILFGILDVMLVICQSSAVQRTDVSYVGRGVNWLHFAIEV